MAKKTEPKPKPKKEGEIRMGELIEWQKRHDLIARTPRRQEFAEEFAKDSYGVLR